ncbi:MAG: putative alpha/beta-fold hydrolase [Gammaproteobacteria bacterium]
MIHTAGFKPNFGFANPHVQTICSVLNKGRIEANRSERVELVDGDFLDINWFDGGGPTVVVMHGLGGSLESHYAIALMNALKRGGYTGVFMHFRGCSGELNRLPRAYHSGDTGDFSAVLDYVREVTAREIFAAVGFSLSANVLLKYLGESGSHSDLQKAVAISVPFDLAGSARKLSQGTSRFYQRHLISILKRSYQQKFKVMTSPVSPDLTKIHTFFHYDDAITAPLHGFDGVDDYYSRSSCNQFIKHINSDTLIVHALDDPFVDQDSIPTVLPGGVKLELSKHGGHVGFLSGGYLPKHWLGQRILSFLSS